MHLHNIPANELKLADIVRFDSQEFPDGMVERVTDTEVHIFRPYMSHAEFESAGPIHIDDRSKRDQRLITYIGHSQYTIPRDTTHVFEVFRYDKQPLRYEGSGLPAPKVDK